MAVEEATPADLPDPMQTLDDDTAANADALLRQLADEEVDRLLTKPDRDASTDIAGDATFSAAPIDRPSEPPPTPTTPTEATANPVEEPLEADLHANTTPHAAEAPLAEPLLSSDLAVAVAEQEQREMLGLDRVPLALRPLLWINRPFDGLNASTRDLLGMIGLVTTVNALVVLLYVMLFRG